MSFCVDVKNNADFFRVFFDVFVVGCSHSFHEVHGLDRPNKLSLFLRRILMTCILLSV